MKQAKRILAAFLALCLLLALTACSGGEEKQTASASPAAQQEAAEEPSKAEEPEPEPEPQPEELYLAAADGLTSSDAFALTLGATVKRSRSGDTTTEKLSGRGQYLRYGQKDMTAVVSGTLVPNTDAYGYKYVFHDGVQFTTVKKTNYYTSCTAEEFLARQIPAVLFDPACYSTITQSEENGQIKIAFSDAVAGESWLVPEGAELIEASGSAVLSADGIPATQKYSVAYRLRGCECQAEYWIDAALTEVPDLSAEIPKNVREYESLDSIDAPELLLRAEAAMESTNVLHLDLQIATYYGLTGLQSSTFGGTDLYYRDGTLGCVSNAGVVLYQGEDAILTKTTTVTFLDDVLTTVIDGEETSRVEIGDSRSYSVKVLPLFRGDMKDLFPSYDSLTDCAVVDLGDYYLMEFTGNESFSRLIRSYISSIYYANANALDSQSSKVVTINSKGYLGVEKNTFMPTACYLSYEGVCTIDGQQVPISLERVLQLTPYAVDTYEAIFGEPEATGAEPITPLLYEVSDGQGGKLYLFGTIHAGDTRMTDLPETVTGALYDSDELAVEFDEDAYYEALSESEELVEEYQEAYFYLDGSTISNHVDSDLYRAALPMMLVTGSYSTLLEYMKPSVWAQEIESFLLETSGTLCSSYGADYTLMNLARDNGIPIIGAESDHEHATLLGRYSDGVQELLLASAVSISRAEYLDEIESFYELWCSGDEAAIRAYLRQDDETPEDLTGEELALYEEYVNSLETQRNAQMLEACIGYLGSGRTVFCAVGVAHLLGEGGLVDQLRAAGYKVEIVK